MVGEKKIKTKLCEKFLQFGMCAFGDHCTYAHGVRELQKAVSTLGSPESSNPSFKTSLCRFVFFASFYYSDAFYIPCESENRPPSNDLRLVCDLLAKPKILKRAFHLSFKSRGRNFNINYKFRYGNSFWLNVS